jgi:hypothetical protein
MISWPVIKQTKQSREEILRTYLDNPEEGTRLAMSRGLSPAYAYRLANERGLLPNKRSQG